MNKIPASLRSDFSDCRFAPECMPLCIGFGGDFIGIRSHVRIYPPAGMNEEEIAVIEGKVADRCVDILIEKGVFICSAVYD